MASLLLEVSLTSGGLAASILGGLSASSISSANSLLAVGFTSSGVLYWTSSSSMASTRLSSCLSRLFSSSCCCSCLCSSALSLRSMVLSISNSSSLFLNLFSSSSLRASGLISCSVLSWTPCGLSIGACLRNSSYLFNCSSLNSGLSSDCSAGRSGVGVPVGPPGHRGPVCVRGAPWTSSLVELVGWPTGRGVSSGVIFGVFHSLAGVSSLLKVFPPPSRAGWEGVPRNSPPWLGVPLPFTTICPSSLLLSSSSFLSSKAFVWPPFSTSTSAPSSASSPSGDLRLRSSMALGS